MYYVISIQIINKRTREKGDPMNNKDIVEMIMNQSPFIRIRANGNRKSIQYAEILEKEFQTVDLCISKSFQMPWANYEDFVFHLLEEKIVWPKNFHIDISSLETETRLGLITDPKPDADVTEAIAFIEKLIEFGNFSCKTRRIKVPDGGIVIVFKR